MEIPAFPGLAFMGILLVASLLLADRKRLRPPQRAERRVWLFRPRSSCQARTVGRMLLALFTVLCGWLVFSHIQSQQPVVEQARLEREILLRAR